MLINGEPGGRLYVDESSHEIRLIDIALLPEQRGHGIGTTLITQLMTRARNTDKTLSLQVEAHNRALRLYLRLGFIRTAEHYPYFLLEWRSSATHQQAALLSPSA